MPQNRSDQSQKQSEESRRDGRNVVLGAILGATVVGVTWLFSGWAKGKEEANAGSSSPPKATPSSLDELHMDKVRVAEKGEAECIICQENRVDCALRPCNHIVLCQSCGVQLKECPVCKTPISARIGPVYL